MQYSCPAYKRVRYAGRTIKLDFTTMTQTRLSARTDGRLQRFRDGAHTPGSCAGGRQNKRSEHDRTDDFPHIGCP